MPRHDGHLIFNVNLLQIITSRNITCSSSPFIQQYNRWSTEFKNSRIVRRQYITRVRICMQIHIFLRILVDE